MKTTRDHRETAARFYCKTISGFVQDWIDGNFLADGIDPDIVELANLLERTYLEGQRDGKLPLPPPGGSELPGSLVLVVFRGVQHVRV